MTLDDMIALAARVEGEARYHVIARDDEAGTATILLPTRIVYRPVHLDLARGDIRPTPAEIPQERLLVTPRDTTPEQRDRYTALRGLVEEALEAITGAGSKAEAYRRAVAIIGPILGVLTLDPDTLEVTPTPGMAEDDGAGGYRLTTAGRALLEGMLDDDEETP